MEGQLVGWISIVWPKIITVWMREYMYTGRDGPAWRGSTLWTRLYSLRQKASQACNLWCLLLVRYSRFHAYPSEQWAFMNCRSRTVWAMEPRLAPVLCSRSIDCSMYILAPIPTIYSFIQTQIPTLGAHSSAVSHRSDTNLWSLTFMGLTYLTSMSHSNSLMFGHCARVSN